MNIFKILWIRRKNKLLKDNIKQSKRKKCCESCKYLREVFNVYTNDYKCLLRQNEFHNSYSDINKIRCKRYEPCRKYKKYLKMKKRILEEY